MNKNVIRTMICLVCVYLCAWYVLKFSFPEQFVLKINNPSIIKFGQCRTRTRKYLVRLYEKQGESNAVNVRKQIRAYARIH